MRPVQYLFGDAVLDTERYELSRDGETVHVRPQVFDVLAHLLDNRERVVAKSELLDAVWGDRSASRAGEQARPRRHVCAGPTPACPH